jgi:hypothetical protein
MIKPIPKKLLVNEVILKEYKENSGEGLTYHTQRKLTNVKIEEKLQLRASNNGKEVVGNALLFYDCFFSKGLSDKPVNESIILFGGKTYKVVDTEILRAGKEPHHYEILLK